MTSGGRQEFAWADLETWQEAYSPSEKYAAPRPADAPEVEVTRIDRGLYTVLVGWHDAFHPYQAQVVAYGADDTRCKFYEWPEPVFVGQVGTTPNLLHWKSRMFVACFNAAGRRRDSKFVFSFSGGAINGTPALTGPAAYFTTIAGGTKIAPNYEEVVDGGPNFSLGGLERFFGACRDLLGIGNPPNHIIPETTSTGDWQTHKEFMSFNSSRGNPLPTIRRTSTGVYEVSLPGLGTPNPGLAQVTALGGNPLGRNPAHCIAGLPVASSTDSPLRVRVEGWKGSERADTDFILNYDQEVTRMYPPAHQGARVYADNWVAASYTPSRSFNTGSIIDAPGKNRAYRMGTGLYRVHHSEIQSTPNSVWVGAAPPWEFLGSGAPGGNYCKVERWVPESRGTDVYIRCYDAGGNLVDSRYFETYQGEPMGPS